MAIRNADRELARVEESRRSLMAAHGHLQKLACTVGVRPGAMDRLRRFLDNLEIRAVSISETTRETDCRREWETGYDNHERTREGN